jgi:hypothetical protein
MASKRKQTREVAPTEAELVALDGLVAAMPADVWLEIDGAALDREAIRRHLAQLIALSRAERGAPHDQLEERS